MSKSYKRNSLHKPKAHGKPFNKDKQPWKNKKQPRQSESVDYTPDFDEPNR